MENEYLIIANTVPGIKLQEVMKAENMADAITKFMIKMDIDIEGNVNMPVTFTIFKLKGKLDYE